MPVLYRASVEPDLFGIDVPTLGGYVLAIIIGIVGIIAARYYARRSREQPRLLYATDHEVILAPDDWLFSDGLRLSYRGIELQKVSRSYVALWLEDGDSVRFEDIVAREPLRVRFDDDDRILAQRIVTRSESAIDARVVIGTEAVSVLLEFDFLNKGDGYIVEILHEKDTVPVVVGTIRGANVRRHREADLTREARKHVRSPRWTRYWSRRSRGARITDLGVMLFVLASVALAIVGFSRQAASASPASLFAGGIFALYAATGIILLVARLARATRTVIPKTIVAEELAVEGEVDHRGSANNAQPFKVGDRVIHRRYGSGQIEGLSLAQPTSSVVFRPANVAQTVEVDVSDLKYPL